MSEVKKLVCNVDTALLDKIDAYAAKLHITRTAAVSVLISKALEQDQLMFDLTRFLDVYNANQGNK